MNYKDFFVVVEQTTPENQKIEILDVLKKDSTLHYLKFRACLQSFISRNRNKRLWKSSHVKAMMQAPHITELIKKGGLPGENGHPVPDSGEVTIERIVSINPNNMSHKINSFEFNSDETLLFGEIETLDDINGPGARFARNIMQGMEPSFSARTLVPQRKYPNGNIDVMGPGRMVTYDRVILPSHEEAYRDVSIPIKNVVKSPNLDSAVEAACESAMGEIISMALESPEVYAVLDSTIPDLSTAKLDRTGTLSVKATEGTIIIPNAFDMRNDIKDFMKGF